MTGFPGWHAIFADGWYEISSEGLSTIYLSITDEGIVTATTDTPASTVYKARILSPEQFSIKRAPIVWPWGDTSGQFAAFGQLQIDNYDGGFDFMVGADLRDTEVIIKLPTGMSFGTATLINDAMTVATAIIDNVTCDNEDIITITLKDTLARLDKSLPVRYNPPFVDPGAANRMVPLSFGAVRNTAPLLIDSPNRIYQLHDSNIANVASVRDKGAALDPHASPPQYVPAISGSGLQLETLPEGKLTVDCSSVGTQAVIDGADDVLDGDGAFLTWAGSPSVPDGWTWSAGSGSVIAELTESDGYAIGTSVNIAKIGSQIPWYPNDSHYGDQLTFEDTLLAGHSYRLSFKIFSTFAAAQYGDGTLIGGIMVRSALDNDQASAISPHGKTLTVPLLGKQSYIYEFTVPAGSTRDLIFIAVPSAGNFTGDIGVGTGGGLIYDVKLELLGEFLDLPLAGISISDYFAEILINRAGEDDTIFNASDLDNIGFDAEGALIPWGIHYDDQPNILDALRKPLDSFGATIYTDSAGTVRARRLNDPSNPIGRTIKAAFTPVNVERPISFIPDNAPNLTTLIGARRNWSIFSDSDFVTDQAIVSQDTKARYMRTSQFQRTSSINPAGQYNFSVGSPIFDSLIDDPDNAQVEIDRVVSIWSPQIYSDGTIGTGKRRFVTFTARFDDPSMLGIGTTCAITDIGFGDVVTLDYPSHGFSAAPMAVVAWELFPFAQKVVLTCLA